MSNKEKFKALVSDEKTNTIERNRERIKNRARLRESQAIALKVLTKLDEPGWSQKKLAEEMGVAPQQITKIVSGTENLTLETQVKLQQILDIPILATYYENLSDEHNPALHVSETEKYNFPSHAFGSVEEILLPKRVIKMDYDSNSKKYEYFQKQA